MVDIIKEMVNEGNGLVPASGTLLICGQTNKILLVQRGKMGSYPGTWAIVGGKMEKGETPLESAKRELYEETKINPTLIEYHYFETQKDLGRTFHFFYGWVNEELKPELNNENLDYGWFYIDELPEPLIPGLKDTLNRLFK